MREQAIRCVQNSLVFGLTGDQCVEITTKQEHISVCGYVIRKCVMYVWCAVYREPYAVCRVPCLDANYTTISLKLIVRELLGG